MIKLICIDISNSAIKVAEIVNTKKGPYIEGLACYQYQNQSGSSLELEQLELLQNIKEQYKNQDIQYVFSLNQTKIAYRLKTFPFTDRIKVLKALPFELEEDLPFSIENAIWDARFIKITGLETEVLAASVTQNYLNKTMEILSPLGFPIEALIPAGAGLHSVIASPFEVTLKEATHVQDEQVHEQKSLSLLLDIGHQTTTVNIYHHSEWIGSSVILWGGAHLTKTLASRYDIDLAEAEKWLTTKGSILLNLQNANYDQLVFSETITLELQQLIREIRLIKLGYESQFNGDVKKIDITGGVSQLINIHPYLTQNLDVVVNPIFFLDRYAHSPLIDQSLAARCAVVIGIGIEALKKRHQPHYQFLKGPWARRNRDFEKLWTLVKEPVIWGGSLIIALMIWSNLKLSATQSLNEVIDEQLKTAGQVIANLGPKQANQKQIQQFITKAKALAKERKLLQQALQEPSALDWLQKISDQLPEHKSLSYQVNEISLQNQTARITITTATLDEKMKLLNIFSQFTKNNKLKDTSSQPTILTTEFSLPTPRKAKQ